LPLGPGSDLHIPHFSVRPILKAFQFQPWETSFPNLDKPETKRKTGKSAKVKG